MLPHAHRRLRSEASAAAGISRAANARGFPISIPPLPTALPAASAPRVGDPDAHGQAALLLVESLIFVLVEGSVLSLRQAIDIVDTAAEVKHEIADELHEASQTKHRSLLLLMGIGASLRRDLGE